jgi:hypothetical protein
LVFCAYILAVCMTTWSWAYRPSGFGLKTRCDTHGENIFWKCARTSPAGPTLGWLGPGLVPYRPSMSYCPWTPLILDIIKICIDFGTYGAFLSSDVLKMVGQQNSWNSLVISTYLLHLEWNICMLVINICILWPPTPPRLRVLLAPKQKKIIKSWRHKQEH